MSSLENVSFGRGDVVFAEGDDVDASPYMYVLSSGKVRLGAVYAPQSLLECFGVAFGDEHRYHGHVMSCHDCLLLPL